MEISFKKNETSAATKSINEGNWPNLLVAVIANLIVFGVIINNYAPDKSDLAQNLAAILPIGIGLIIVRVANGQFSDRVKALLVFWWDDLPGSQAFSRHARNDKRIDLDNLRKRFPRGKFPKEAEKQNSQWYKFYIEVADRPSVAQANRNYLLTRDYTGVSFLLLILLGAAAFWIVPAKPAAFYLSGLVVQYLLVSHAAKVYAIELVRNVLALIAATPPNQKPATAKK